MARAMTMLDPSQQTMERLLVARARQKRLGDWCRGAATGDREVRKALSEQIGTYGGYLVPEELMVGIDAEVREQSVFLQRAFVVPMTTATLDVGGFDISSTNTAGRSPLFAGMDLHYTFEGNTIDELDPSFAQCKLVAKNLDTIVLASNQLVDDGGAALGAYLEWQFAKLIAWKVEWECINGTGVGQFLGLLNSPGTASVSRSLAGTVSQADLSNMVGVLMPACFRKAVWLCSVTALAKVANVAAYSANPNPEPGPLCGYLFNRPLFVTENLPAVGTTGDVLLLDPTLYVLGLRRFEIETSREFKFQTNQTAFRLQVRGDGQPLVRNTFKLADNATTVGTVVQLA